MKRKIKGRVKTFPSLLNNFDRVVILISGGVFSVFAVLQPIVKLFLNY